MNLTTDRKHQRKRQQRHSSFTLRRQLLQIVLPAVIVPLFISGGLGLFVLQRHLREDAYLALHEDALIASEAARIFIEDTFKILDAVALTPILGESLQEADEITEVQDLEDKSIDELEEQFDSLKLLTPSDTHNDYLRQVVVAEKLGTLLVTDQRGLSLAYSEQPSTFVHRDQEWWVSAKQEGRYVGSPEFDQELGAFKIVLAQSLIDPLSGDFRGVIQATVPIEAINERLSVYSGISSPESEHHEAEHHEAEHHETQRHAHEDHGHQRRMMQLFDTQAERVFLTIGNDEINTEENQTLQGNQDITQLIADIVAVGKGDGDMVATVETLNFPAGIKLLEVENLTLSSGRVLSVIVESKSQKYNIVTVPASRWVAIAITEAEDLVQAGSELLPLLGVTTIVLGAVVVVLLSILSKQISMPLAQLTELSKQAADGDLNVRATPTGTVEVQTLSQSMNQLLQQIQSLVTQQRNLATQQQQQREELETDISQLMEDVGDAADGDLTVRAQLSASDVGIVADLFNAIVENLRDTAIRVKSTTDQVGHSLANNETEIQQFSQQAKEEVQALQDTVMAMEIMSRSIQSVAERANQASTLTQDTYATVQASSQSMDETVSSIVNLRSTVGETAKKIKRLGESAQKISQTVSLIDEIALKTNLLAVNASVEAARAGELGQGFTAVAEQVGALAEQSAQATKDIARIVADIQMETQEVVAAIEIGTAQVVDSSEQVETTKQRLNQVLAKSEEITQLMGLISDSTVEQIQSSTAVTTLMQQAAQESAVRSDTSNQIAQAIRATALVAQELQTSVEQFKVTGAPLAQDVSSLGSLTSTPLQNDLRAASFASTSLEELEAAIAAEDAKKKLSSAASVTVPSILDTDPEPS